MAKAKFKWKSVLFFYVILVNVCIKGLPIGTHPSFVTSDSVFKSGNDLEIQNAADNIKARAIAFEESENGKSNQTTVDLNQRQVNVTGGISDTIHNNTRNNLFRQVRPGQTIRQYALELTPGWNVFTGRAVIDVELVFATREDPIELHAEGLTIQSVMAGVFTEANALQADFSVDDGILEISPQQLASTYILIIEYTGSLSAVGQGFYRGQFEAFDYLAMNLHPTHARRVFPCMDEPTEASIISFTFNNIDYTHLMSNSLLEDNSNNQFRALQGPPHLWGMVAHNLNAMMLSTTGAFLYIRPGVSNQESQAVQAINFFYTSLVEWTNKPHEEIVLNQAAQLSILAIPDVSRDWVGLSNVVIWEPYVLMETTCSIKQRFTAFVKIAQSLAKQWFGQVIYPENWRYEWVVSGLATYAAYDILKEYQNDVTGLDTTLLDINTLFVTEIIQESLYRDGYTDAQTLEIEDDIFDEDDIRDYMAGIQKVKAPALFWMMRVVLGDQSQDFIRSAGRALITSRSLQTVNFLNFVDAVNSDWLSNGNGAVDGVDDYIEPWVQNNGYPLIHIGLRQGGVLVTQERFGFSSQAHVAFNVPITYTTSVNPNYENIFPIQMMEGTMTFNMFLDEDEGDYVLFNIQGQGYYRVNYDNDLWDRIIEALEDPDRRAEIHPLNRATLIDDALNLARAGRIDYDIAFRVVLSMEHETEYAPWKAFIRNMNFLRKRLVALVEEDEDLDPDIYLRMVRRSIVTFEQEVTFTPDPAILEPAMTSLTRGLVMDHACRAGYQPCIAAAVDWFYSDNDNEVVNPNIPSDIRPAVYCTMVKEGGDDVINALYQRLDIEPSMYERVVILESLACSNDMGFVRTLLEETIAVNSPYSVEERVRIFIAVAEGSFSGAREALSFVSTRTNEIRNMYGGDEKLEEAINALMENMADINLTSDYNIWIYSQNNNLQDSQEPAQRAAAMAMENLLWNERFIDYVYEWIDENDAPTIVVSFVLISISCFITLFNH